MQKTSRRLIEQDTPKPNINAANMVPVFDWDDTNVWLYVKQPGGNVLGPMAVPHHKVKAHADMFSWLPQAMWVSGKIDPETYTGLQDIVPPMWVPGQSLPSKVPSSAPKEWKIKMVFTPIAASSSEVEIAHKVVPKPATADSEGSLPVVPGELADTGKTDANGFPLWKDKTSGQMLSLLPGDKLAMWSPSEHKYHFAIKTSDGWAIDFTVPFMSPEDLDTEKKVPHEVLPKGFELPPGYVLTHADASVVMAKTPKGTAVKWLAKSNSWVYLDTPWQAHNPGEEEIDKAAKAEVPEKASTTTVSAPPHMTPLPAVTPEVSKPVVPEPVKAAVAKAPEPPGAKTPPGFELPDGHTLTSVTPKAVFAKTPGGVAVKWVVKLRSWWFVDHPGEEYRPGEGGVGTVVAPPVQSAPPPPPPPEPEAKVEPPVAPKSEPVPILPGAPKNPKGFGVVDLPNQHGLWPIEHLETYDDGNWFVHPDGEVFHFHPASMDYIVCKYGPMGWIEDNSAQPVSGAHFAVKKFYGRNPKIPDGYTHVGYDPNGFILVQKGSGWMFSLLPNGTLARWLAVQKQYKTADQQYLPLDSVLAGNFGKAAWTTTVAEIPEEPPHWLTYTGKLDPNGFPMVDEHSYEDDEEVVTGLTLLPDERAAKWVGSKYQVYKYVEVTHTLKADKKAPSLSVDDVKEMMQTLGLVVQDARYHRVLDSNKVYDPSFPPGWEPLNPVDGEAGLVPVRQVSTNKKFYMLPGAMVATDVDGDLTKFNVFGISGESLIPKSEYLGLTIKQVLVMTKGLDPNPPAHTRLSTNTDKNGYSMVFTQPADPDITDELSLLPNGSLAKWDPAKKKYVVWEWDEEFKDFGPDVTLSYTLKQVQALQAKKLPGMPKAVPAVKPSEAVVKPPDPTPAPDYAMQDTGDLDENGHTVQKHLLTGKLFSLLPTSQPTLGIWMSQMKAYRMVDWDPASKSYLLAWKDEEPIWYLPGDPDVYVGAVETGGVKKTKKKPPSAELTPISGKDLNGYEQSVHKKGGPDSTEPPDGPFAHLPGGKIGLWDGSHHYYKIQVFNSDSGKYEPSQLSGSTFVPPGKVMTTGTMPLGMFLPKGLPSALDKLELPLHADTDKNAALMLPNGMFIKVPVKDEQAIEFMLRQVGGFESSGITVTQAELVKFLKQLDLLGFTTLKVLGTADPNQMPLFEPMAQPGVKLSLLPNGKYALWNASEEYYTVWEQSAKGTGVVEGEWLPAKPFTTYTKAVTLPGGSGYVDHVEKLQAFKAGETKEDGSKLSDTGTLDQHGLKKMVTPLSQYLAQLPSGTVLGWNPYEGYYEVMEFSTAEGLWVAKSPLQTLYPVEAKLALSNDPSALEAVGNTDLNGFPKYQGKDSDDRFVKLPDGQFAEFENLSGKYIPVTWDGSFWKRHYGKAYTTDQALVLGKTTPETSSAKESKAGPPDPKKPDGFDQVEDLDDVDKNGLPVVMTKQGLKLSWLPNGQFATWAAAAKRYSVRELVNDTWLPKHPVLKYTLDEVMLMVDAHGPFKPNGPKAMYKGTTGPIPFLGHFDDLGLPAYESGDVEIDMHRLPDGTWVLWDDDAGKYYKIEQNPSGSWAMVYPDVIFYKKDVLDMIGQEAAKKSPPLQITPAPVAHIPVPLSPEHPSIMLHPGGPDANGIKRYLHQTEIVLGQHMHGGVVWHPGQKKFYGWSQYKKAYAPADWSTSSPSGGAWVMNDLQNSLSVEEMLAATLTVSPGLPAGLHPGHPDIIPDPNGHDPFGIKSYIHKFQNGKKFATPVVWHPAKKKFFCFIGQGYVEAAWSKVSSEWKFYFDAEVTPNEMLAATADTAEPPSGFVAPPGLPAGLKPLLGGSGVPLKNKYGLNFYFHEKNPSEHVVMTPGGEFYTEMPAIKSDDLAYIPVAWQENGEWGSLPNKPILTNDQFAELLSGKAPTVAAGATGLPPWVKPWVDEDGEQLKDKHGFPYYQHAKDPEAVFLKASDGKFYFAGTIPKTGGSKEALQVTDTHDVFSLDSPQKANIDLSTPAMGTDEFEAHLTSLSGSPGPEYVPYSGGYDENGFPRYVRADEDPDAPFPVTLLPNGEFARWLGLSKLYQVMQWDPIPPPSWAKAYKEGGANKVYTLSEVEAMEAGKVAPTPLEATGPALGNLVKIAKTDKNGLTYYQDSKHPSFKLSLLPDGHTFGHWVSKKQSYQKMALQPDGSWESATFPTTFITLSDVEAMKIAMGHIASATPPSTPLTPSTLAPGHPDIVEEPGTYEDGLVHYHHEKNPYVHVVWVPTSATTGSFMKGSTSEHYQKVEWSDSEFTWKTKTPVILFSVDEVKILVDAAKPDALSPTHPDIVNSGEVKDDFMLYHHKLNPHEQVVWVGGKFYYPAAKTYHEAKWASSSNEWMFVGTAALTPSEMKALSAAEAPGGAPAFDPLGSILGLHPSLKALLTKDDNGYDQAEVIAEPGKKLTVLPNGQMAKWSLSAQKYFKVEFDEADKFWSTADPPQKWTLDQVKAMSPSSSAPVSDDEPDEDPAEAVVDTNFSWNPVPGIPDLKDLTYVGDGKALGYAGMGKKDIFEDPNTKQRFIFKPAIPKGGSKTELFRARVQEAYAAFAVKIRSDHIPIKTVTYNGQVGTIQPELKVKTNTLKGVGPETLTASQREELTVDHVLDWVMSQHDTHGDNVIITDDGRLLTIDKEQGFRYLFDKSKPDKLSTDYQPNDTVFTPYYNIFWKAFEKGKFDLNMTAMSAAIAKVVNLSSEDYLKLITPYAESVWPNDPKKQDRFKKRALKRKLTARSDFEEFLTKIYKNREGESGKFTFESGWVSDKKAHETMFVTKTLQGPSFVSWAEAEHHVSVYPYKDPTTNSPPPTPQDKIILKLPSGMPKEKLLDFLAEMGLEPLPEYPLSDKAPTPTMYSGSDHHKVIVKKSAWEALSITKTLPIHPGAISPTPETPSYWSGVEDLPPAPPNVEVLKSVHEKTDIGPGGVRVTFDGGKVEGHHGRVKRYKDSKGVYYLKHFKLRESVWQELDAALLAQKGANKKWVKEDFTFYQAPYDKASDCLVENGIEIDSTSSKKFVFPEGEVYFVSSDYKYTYTGSLYIKVRKPGPLFDSIKSILNKIQPNLGTELLKPPTAEETEQRKLLQVIWSFDPKRHDQLKKNVPDLATLRAEAKKAAKKAGFSAKDIDSIEEREVYANHNALVLPGRSKKLAKGRLWFLLQRAKKVDAVVNVAKQGLAGIHERNMSGIEQFGSSYGSDVNSGSGDQTLLFCVPECSESVNSIGSGYGEYWFIVHPDALDRLDAYFYPTDGWGVCKEGYTGSGADWSKRNSLEENFDSHLANGFSYNEVMLRTGVSIDKVLRFAASSESLRKQMIDALRDAGIPKVNGIPVEDFVVRLGSAKACFETYVKPVVV